MVNLLPDAEQRQIIDSIADFLGAELPLARFRPGASHLREAARWQDLASQGFFGLGLAEGLGGVGYTVAEEVLMFREFGRVLLSPSVLAATLAARATALSGIADIADGILSGQIKVGLAIPIEPAERSSRQFYLIDAVGADLVFACDDTGATVFERGGFADIAMSESLDDGVAIEVCRLTDSAIVLQMQSDEEPLAQRLEILSAAMLVGIAETARDMAVEYAKVRQQFGQAIGAFQAIKHRCADIAVRAELALSQLLYAAIVCRDGGASTAFHVAAAKLLAADAALKNAASNIQVHGGIGFTAECNAHLLLKRAHLLEHVGGSVRQQRVRILAEPFPG